MARIKTGAIVISWDSIIPGREAKMFEVFGKVLQYASELERAGRIFGTQMFVPMTRPGQDTLMVLGELEQLADLLIDDAFEALTLEGMLVANHLSVGLVAGGAPESLQEGLQMSADKMKEHGLL